MILNWLNLERIPKDKSNSGSSRNASKPVCLSSLFQQQFFDQYGIRAELCAYIVYLEVKKCDEINRLDVVLPFSPSFSLTGYCLRHIVDALIK